MTPWNDWPENAVIALGIAAGVGSMAALDWWQRVLQRRIVIGWAEHFTCEAVKEEETP